MVHRHFKKTLKITLKIAVVTIFVLLVALFVWFISGEGVKDPGPIKWGVTFSSRQTEYLGLDSGRVYKALLDDMKVRHLRLMAPWYQIEPGAGKFDFSDMDWYLREAQKRDAKVILAVGRKLYRWPECHEPSWAVALPAAEFEERVLTMLGAAVNHFKQFDNIVGWQVENEVILPFGECASPKPNLELFRKEVDLVKALDDRPVISTESGELSSWLKIGGLVDKLGVSLYRITNNPWLGKFYYPLRPGFYQKKAQLARALQPNLQAVFISELQLEPWGEKPLTKMTLAEQFASMNFAWTESTIAYARRTGLNEIYLWGAEWWYWLRQAHGDNRFWDLGKSLMTGNALPPVL